MKVFILSMHNKKRFIVKLMDVGAKGYILKNKSEKELISALYLYGVISQAYLHGLKRPEEGERPFAGIIGVKRK